MLPKLPQGCPRRGLSGGGGGGNFGGLYLFTMVIKLGHVCGYNMNIFEVTVSLYIKKTKKLKNGISGH